MAESLVDKKWDDMDKYYRLKWEQQPLNGDERAPLRNLVDLVDGYLWDNRRDFFSK